jgi:hypothetical protein
MPGQPMGDTKIVAFEPQSTRLSCLALNLCCVELGSHQKKAFYPYAAALINDENEIGIEMFTEYSTVMPHEGLG